MDYKSAGINGAPHTHVSIFTIVSLFVLLHVLFQAYFFYIFSPTFVLLFHTGLSAGQAKKLLNVEKEWDGEMGCSEVMGPCCFISEEEVSAAIKVLIIVSEMKASGGFGSG